MPGFFLVFWPGICVEVDVDKFPGEGWDKVITIGRVCIVQYRIIFSFHLAKRTPDPDPG